MSQTFTVSTEPSTRPPDRRIVRIALVGDPIKSAAKNLRILQDACKSGQATPVQQAKVADMLDRITTGEDLAAVLGQTIPRHKAKDPDRTMMIALDYFMRSIQHPKPTKIAEHVAADWKEKSVDTVKQINRRERPHAMKLVGEWLSLESGRKGFDRHASLTMFAEAVQKAREQILSGSAVGKETKRASEIVEVDLFLGHVLNYYAERGGITEAGVTWTIEV